MQAPERFAGRPASAAGDWYAVGVMLYESLVAKRPFHGSRTRLIWQQRYMDTPEPAERDPNVPAEWNELCLALIHRDPARRPDGPELIRRLKIHVGVSVDGPAFLHDRRRRTRQGAGTLERVLAGIRCLREHDIPLWTLGTVGGDLLEVAPVLGTPVAALAEAHAHGLGRALGRDA